MFDGWESNHGCLRWEWADLAGYRRVFNKKSVQNWGTSEHPGLTLNLEKFDAGRCRGIAFEFPDTRVTKRAVLNYLSKREACAPRMLPILISKQQIVQAHVYLYEGKNVLDPLVRLAQRADMVMSASGTSGACCDYIRQSFTKLASVGIDDQEVTALWNAVRDRVTKQPGGRI